MAVFWTLLGIFTVVNLAVFRRPVRRDSEGAALHLGRVRREELPRVSIVIPARDEERALGATLRAALDQDWPQLQVVVVDDQSRDATPAIVATYAAADRRLVPVDGAPPPPGWLGKPHALAQGSEAAAGDWLLFMDADVELDPLAVASAVAHAEERGLDHLALFPFFVRRGFWEQVLMPTLALALLLYFPSFLSRLHRPRFLRSLAFGSGSFNLVRAKAYRQVGGHGTLRDSVIDDIRLAIELKQAGCRSQLALGDRLARIRMYHGRREIFAGFEKNLHAMLARHPWFSLFNLTVGTLFNLAPFAWPFLAAGAGLWGTGMWGSGDDLPWAASAAGGWLAAALAMALAARGAVHRRLGYPLWVVALHPLGVLAGSWIALRSLAAAYGEGVVRWRGREYRRDQTRF